ncbi:hypothetical protein TVAG_221790 [Trichomonas vaginalis G3]|uniref:Uncharacterized protein n=1 Tax=Trichomonas vaginalis (strain ATCC PRA-98 / G3) TaxID=412133 RepID=A2E3D5_TRIV3|nr:hypothetical protein TVAGG3_0969860 [Trichomonas vaginalis G3]EAY12826.1 hypothetical protein TVAG_221790 [Trichomonas vaginalis G3]KAI5488516.1 hypothetical protein TVAGG3_0969860 [Trichomonas vaginalis G3]|eukprot:XP_001325049.1 hypothetical protein [Trichomonas vaginalis G3]
MSSNLTQVIAQIQEEFNKRLDDLELGLSSITESISEVDNAQINKDEISKKIESYFPETFSDEPSKAIDEVLTAIKFSLATKSNTKKLIEKANRQYVDLGFQRASTELSASLKQMVTQEEQSIEEEITRLEQKIDKLHDQMYESFKDLRCYIDEVAKFKMEKEAEQSAYAHDRGYRGRGKKVQIGIPLLKRNLRKQKPSPTEDSKPKLEKSPSLELVVGKSLIKNLSQTTKPINKQLMPSPKRTY